MTRTDTATTGIMGTLDSFYCYNVTAALWADAVINRLGGAITADPACCSTAASSWSSPSPTAPTSPRSANTP